MNVLITGGAGYVGYSLVKELLKQGDGIKSIVIYDNLSRKNYNLFTEANFEQRVIRFVNGDILDGRTLQKSLEGIDCVYHLAARVTTPYADHEAHIYDQVNNWGTAQLANAIEKSNVTKLVYLSSISVYGSSQELMNERTEPNPHSFYGISKLDGERQLGAIGQKCGVHIIRSGNVYGFNPAYRIDAVVNRFMFNANFHQRIQINGSGHQARTFIHVDKLGKVLADAAAGNIPPGLYNAAEYNMTINEVAGVVRSLYPSLETIHVNYNIEMRHARVELPCKVLAYSPLPEKSIEEEMEEFRRQFSF